MAGDVVYPAPEHPDYDRIRQLAGMFAENIQDGGVAGEMPDFSHFKIDGVDRQSVVIAGLQRASAVLGPETPIKLVARATALFVEAFMAGHAYATEEYGPGLGGDHFKAGHVPGPEAEAETRSHSLRDSES